MRILNGMSGTIGDQEERKLLSLEYGTNCFELPRFRKYRFQYEKSKEFVGISESEWCEQIIKDIKEKMNATLKSALEELSKELNKEQKERNLCLEKIKKSEEEKKILTEEIQELSADGNVKESKNKYTTLEKYEKEINAQRECIDKIDKNVSCLKEGITFRQTQRAKLERNIRDYEQILLAGDKRDKQRAVLIICKNIADLEKITAKVRQEFPSNKNIYTYDRAYRKFGKNVLNPGDIIIATNIAGRGTDLTVDKLLEANGGLHVILTYIPGNLRVQQQAFGRTARGGKRGTGVYIVYDLRKMMLIPDMTVDFLLNERDEKEKERLDEIVRKSFPKIKIENILFEKFNLFKEEIKSKIEESFSKSKAKNISFQNLDFPYEQVNSLVNRTFLLNSSESDFNRKYLELQLNSLQNHWAFWLNEMDEKLTKVHETGPELIFKNINEFKDRILRELDSNTYGLITDPGELIKLSQLFMGNKKYIEARDCYSQIIEKHPDFSDIAHYYKAFCIIHLGGEDRGEIIKAKLHLKKALSLLELKRSAIMSRIQILLSLNHITQQKGQNVNYFKKQNEGEAQILSYHINAVLQVIGSEISSENFCSGTITGDTPTEIYHELLKDNYDIIKDTRISKKIIIGSKVLKISEDENIGPLLQNKGKLLTYEDFQKLDFNESGYRNLRNKLQKKGILSTLELYKKVDYMQDDPQCITFPNVFKYCQEEVLNDLESVLIQSQQQNWSYKKRIIKENFFEAKVFHKDTFLIATQDIVKQREMVKISNNVSDDLVGKLDDPVFCDLGSEIKKLLLGKELILFSAGDRINRDTFLTKLCQKLSMSEIEYKLIKFLLSGIFEETIEIVNHVSETLKQNIAEKLKTTNFNERIEEIQKAVQELLCVNVQYLLTPGDIIQKTTLIETLKRFTLDPPISEEKIMSILNYLEFNETLRINENLNAKFDDNTNDQVFCGKETKVKEFLLGNESYTLTSGEKVSIGSGNNKVSKSQLTKVMKEIGITDDKKINDIFKHLALEFDSVKFIKSYTEFYLNHNDIKTIQEYLSKISFTLTDNHKEEMKTKIEMLNFIEIGSLNNKSKHIKEILLRAIEHNKSDLTENDFCLNQEEFELLRGVLQDNGIIKPMLYKLLSESHNKSSCDIDESFFSNLENIFILLYYNDGRISEENLSLRTANEVSKELFCRLRESTVIKDTKVHFKFTYDPEKRIENIRKQVEDVVMKVFNLKREDNLAYDTADWIGVGDFVTSNNKELDEYIDSITNTLKQCAGVLRTLPKVKISEKNLKTMFQTGQIPPEIMDYVLMCFDSVLSLEEKKSLWDWNAFYCAMIGIAQIAAGIALDICTCGAAHYFAQGLIAEGIGDIVFAIQSGLQGNFSWKAYCQHKVQSIIISLLTAGVGSYLSKGTKTGVTGARLATKTAMAKAIAKETLTHLTISVASAIVNITTDELSQFIMNEILDKHLAKVLDEWIANDAIYKAKKMTLDERFRSIYEKFGAEDAKNIIKESIYATLLDLQRGDLASMIFNRVMQTAHGISGAFSSAARIVQKKKSKAVLLSSIAKMIDKTVTSVRISKIFVELCTMCHRFCEILDKKLLESFNNKKEKSNIEKIKEENMNISISANISEHIKSMEDQMKAAINEKVKNDFLKPGVQFTLNHAMKPIQEFITSPFVDAREELEEHINKRADEFIVLIREKGHESLKKLNSGKIRALEQLGLLIDVKHLSSEDLNRTVCNLNGESIEELQKQHGDNVRFAAKDEKLLALPPTYKEYMDNIENGIYAGLIHFKLVAEKNNTNIEIVDPENNYQPHTDAPNGGTINPTKNVNGKSMKVAYIRSKEKGKVGHIAPVIEVDGKLQVVDISQNLGTKDQCFAQTMLFYEKYKEGKINMTDISSIHDYGISSADINRFNTDLAQFGRGCSSVRYDYHEGVTAKNSQLLGGARREQRPFAERVHSNPRAGNYGHLDRRWRGRKGIYEINHIPPIASYRDTPYQDISQDHMPVIAMLIEDHRGMSSTGSSHLAFSHRSTVQECLRRGDMYSAMKLELNHTLTIKKSTMSYENTVLQYINYVGSAPVKGAPLNLDGTRTLLTRSQAFQLQEELFRRNPSKKD